ncbi:MAG: aminotransferase class I/II-fold pyridoxal phosphate-dependent enzyme [Firmicutes bacterium]|nr:aminotransferase class I/II-fold pyridoxal phosphate-dependent enzyme [Bacillota bacterium]
MQIEETGRAYDFENEVSRAGTGNMKGRMAEKLREKGIADPIVLFGAEMDFPTAPCIREKLEAFAREGIYGFTLADEAYLDAICWWIEHVRGMEVAPEWILPVQGTTFALSICLRALTKPGEKVLLMSPSYYRFDRAVLCNEREPIYHSLLLEDDGYQINWTDLERKLSDPACTLMVLVNPHNPTGKVFREEDLRRIAALAGKHKVTVFSDEIFAETAQPGFEVMPYIAVDPMGITCTSLGKAFNLTGVNQANLIVPDETLREKLRIQRDRDHFGSIDPFFYQELLAAYTPEGADWIREVNTHTAENARLVRETLREQMPKIRLLPVEGTFIGWLDCRNLGLDDPSLEAFFEQAGIYADPGIEYGEAGRGFYRWNLATPREKLEKALRQLKEVYDEKA